MRVSVELLTTSAAKQRPVGKGRKEPNDHPLLEDPDRETLSLFHPFKALKFFVGPARVRKAGILAVMALALTLFWSMIPQILSEILSKFIAVIPVFSASVPCDASYAKAGALYMEFCGERDKPFQPQTKHWLDCLGPAVDVCSCSLVDVTDEDTNAVTQQHQCTFDDSRCQTFGLVKPNVKCYQGQADARELKSALSSDDYRALLDRRCTHGGDSYLLAHYSEDCRDSMWPSWIVPCDNSPCEDQCVPMNDPDCPPPLEAGVDAFFKWLLLRIAIPAVVVYVLYSMRHLGRFCCCRKKCNVFCCCRKKCNVGKIKDFCGEDGKWKEICGHELNPMSVLCGAMVAVALFVGFNFILRIFPRKNRLISSIMLSVFVGAVCYCLLQADRIDRVKQILPVAAKESRNLRECVRRCAKWVMYTTLFLAMYWATGQESGR